MGFLKMRTKIAVVLALLVIVPVTSLGILVLQEQRELVSRTVEEMNAGFTALLASHVFRLLDSTRRQLETICAIPEVREFDARAITLILEATIKNSEIIEGLVVYDASRRVVAQQSWDVRRDAEHVREARRFFTNALLDRYGFSDHVDASSGTTARNPTVMSAIIYGPDDTIQGVIRARISGKVIRRSLDELFEQVKEAYKELDLYVVTEDGQLVMASRGAEYEKALFFPAEEVRRRTGAEPVKLRKFRPYQTPDWRIWVLPQAGALASLEAVRRSVLSIALLAMVAALLIGTLFVASITRPVNDLVKGALAISRGELSRPITVRATDEIGKLSESFELMRQNLVRMQGHLKDRIEELQTLYGVGRALSSTLDLNELLHIVLDRVMAIMKAERGSIMLYDEEKDELYVEVSRGGDGGGPARGARVKIGERVSGHVLQTGRPLLIQDTEASPNLARLKAGEVASGTLLSVPLILKDKRLGVLNVSKSTPFTFDEKDQELFTALANQGAIAIENARLYTLAITDELTKLFIRRFFYQRLREEMRRSLRYDKPLSVLVMDVDKFKNFNDTYGHQAGDEVLQFVARTMKECVRTVDLVARLGGEEFAVLCPELSDEEAWAPAERIRKTLEETDLTLSNGTVVNVTTSIGISQFPRDGDHRDTLLDAADQALYHAKRTGRNRICYYTEIDVDAEEREAS